MNITAFPRHLSARWLAVGFAWSLIHIASCARADDSTVTPSASNQTMNAASATMPLGKRGTWVWNKESWLAPADRDTLFNFLRKHGISVMLVQIHTDYSGEKPVLENRSELSALLREA